MSNHLIIFPENIDKKIKYYPIHYLYLLNVLKAAGVSVKIKKLTSFDSVGFMLQINDIDVIIDFSDHIKILPRYDVKSNIPYFKYHYDIKNHGEYKKVFPFSPVSFHNWGEYKQYVNLLKYRGIGNILNNQRPGGNALERRVKVQKILKSVFWNADLEFYPNQLVFWKLISTCLVSVCVPGARNDILDRGQFQYMAFGCCTLSPIINCTLSWYKKLEPGVHYVECKPDYSDLVERIDWCSKHRDACLEIGKNAKKLFNETSTPYMLWKWILECIGK